MMNQVAIALAQGFTYAFGFMVNCIIYVATLYYLVLLESPPLSYVANFLQVIDNRNRIQMALEGSIQAVLLATTKLAAFHFLFTWLTFSMVDIEWVVTGSLISALFAVIPVISPFWMVVPAALELFIRTRIWAGGALLMSHLWVIFEVDTSIYSDIPDTHHYVVGYSVILGLGAFGLEGVVLGPILACIPVIVYQIFSNIVQ
jgi:predicted PurR-regulated permease PerM